MEETLSTHAGSSRDASEHDSRPGRMRPETEVTVERSRSWSRDLQMHWQSKIPHEETKEQRLNRYNEYFLLTESQMKYIYGEMCLQLMKASARPPTFKDVVYRGNLKGTSTAGCTSSTGGNAHTSNPSSAFTSNNSPSQESQRSFQDGLASKTIPMMIDTHIPCEKAPGGELTGGEKGVKYVMTVSSTQVRAVRVKLEGKGRISSLEHCSIIDRSSDLVGPDSGALEFMDFLVEVLRGLLERTNELSQYETDDCTVAPLPLALVIGFPCMNRSRNHAKLLSWTKGYMIGRSTEDPLEGMDIVTLLNVAFKRRGLRAQVKASTNEAVAMLFACEYEKSPRLATCAVSLMISSGFNCALVDPTAPERGYVSSVLNTEIGNYDRALPVNDVDLEVDYSDYGNRGAQMLEKMVAGFYMGELCRRLIIKIWQSEAPALAWCKQALPTAAAALCAADESSNLDVVGNLMRSLWEWNVSLPERQNIRKACRMVFHRSAGLAAIAVAALAKQSTYLQPAMGGLTVAIEGQLHTAHPWYTEQLRSHLATLLGLRKKLIDLYVVHDGPAKGGAFLF